MKTLLQSFKHFGRLISRVIVLMTLTLVYLLMIAPYSLFVKSNRKIINRNHVYKTEDLDRMF